VSDERYDAEAHMMAGGGGEPSFQEEVAGQSARPHDDEMIDLSTYFGHVDTPQPEAVLVEDDVHLDDPTEPPAEKPASSTDDELLVMPMIPEEPDDETNVDTGPNGIIRITQAAPDSEALEGALANTLDAASEIGNLEIADVDTLTGFVPPNVSQEPPQRAFGEVTYTETMETVPAGIGDFGTVGGKQLNEDAGFDEPPSSVPPLRFRAVRHKRTSEDVTSQAATSLDQPQTEVTHAPASAVSSRQDAADNDLSAALSALGVDDLTLRDTVLTSDTKKAANDQPATVSEAAGNGNERSALRSLRGRKQRRSVPEPEEVADTTPTSNRKTLSRPLIAFVSVGLVVGSVAIFVGLDRLETASHHVGASATATTTPSSTSTQPRTTPPGTSSKSSVSLSAACNDATKIVAISLTTSTPASTVQTSLTTDAAVVSSLAHTAPAAWQPAVDKLDASISALIAMLRPVGWSYSAVPTSDYGAIQTAADQYNAGIQDLNAYLRTCS